MAESKAKQKAKQAARPNVTTQETTKAPERANMPPAPAAATYAASELAQAAHIFGTYPEAVLVALKEKGITHTTEAAAHKIVAAFLERKV